MIFYLILLITVILSFSYFVYYYYGSYIAEASTSYGSLV